MTTYDKKIFWKYFFAEYVNPKKFIKTSTFYEYILLLILSYIIFLTKLSRKIKVICFISFLIIIAIIKTFMIYKSGIHKGWWRQKTGIPTKSFIKKIKQRENDNSKP
jgi:uncharacterized membrane protein YcaP (DUF421 family)